MSQEPLRGIFEQKKPFLYAFGVLLLLSVLYIVVGSSSWAVDPIESPTQFCEDISDGLVKEPMNSLDSQACP